MELRIREDRFHRHLSFYRAERTVKSLKLRLPLNATMSIPQTEIDSSAPNSDGAEQSWRELVDRPVALALVLFFVTAALGLPLLWISRGFSLAGKIVLTILVLIWTAVVLWVFYLVMGWCLPRIWEAIQILTS